MLEEKLRIIKLFDVYGGFLTERQRQIMEDYYINDNSLSEIAEVDSISKQAIHDSVKKSIKALEKSEEEIGLIKKTEKIKTELLEMLKNKKITKQCCDKILEILEE